MESSIKARKTHFSQYPITETLIGKDFYSIREECSKAGWDGHNCEPLNDAAVLELISFSNLLPASFNDYEIVPEPTGDIGLEWVSKTNHTVISFSGQNKIIYACIFDKVNKVHGEERFGDIIPESITALLLRFYKN